MKKAILALNTDARLTSITLTGSVLQASWRRRVTSLRVGKGLWARLEDVAHALVAAVHREAAIVSVTLKGQQLTVFVKRGAADLDRARRLAMVVHQLARALQHPGAMPT